MQPKRIAIASHSRVALYSNYGSLECEMNIIIIEFIVIPLHDDNDILHLYMMMMMTFNIYT